MQLYKLQYKEFVGSPKYWSLDLVDFENINLIVGKNASGKSRVLNVITGLAKLIFNSAKITFRDGHYIVGFKRNVSEEFYFEVKIIDGIVQKEVLKLNDEILIDRNENGKGQIKNHLGTYVEFKIPSDELISGRKDEIQYPYLELLYSWATFVRKFRFTHERQKTSLALIDSNLPKTKEFDLRETDKVLSVFNKGIQKYGKTFTGKIITDFNNIGYDISQIDVGEMISITIEVSAPGSFVSGLRVKEKDIEGLTDQAAMSDGMFRALSIIIHFVYYELEGLSGCILIDDIGEGLDFERSSNLITLLVEKAEKTNVQLIMSTNDKFVMNNTDLKYWQIIHRQGGNVHLFNQKNSTEVFNSFKYTGLNNFDFFITDFFKTGFEN